MDPPRSPRLPAGEGEDTATPPPPRIYHLCVCSSKPQPLRTEPTSALTGDTARSAGSSSAAASSREASVGSSGSSERPRGTAGAGGRRHLPLLRLLLARRGGEGELGEGEGSGKAALTAAPVRGAQGHSDPGGGRRREKGRGGGEEEGKQRKEVGFLSRDFSGACPSGSFPPLFNAPSRDQLSVQRL